MIEQSDQSLRASLRKVYGSIRALQQMELRRRLLATPEFFYCADEPVSYTHLTLPTILRV